jgi:hypothetical protein
MKGARVAVCGCSLSTVVHDAFRPSVQSAEGSHQVQLGVERGEAGGAASARQSETDDTAIAESEATELRIYSSLHLIHP